MTTLCFPRARCCRFFERKRLKIFTPRMLVILVTSEVLLQCYFSQSLTSYRPSLSSSSSHVRSVIVFTTPRHFVRSHASLFPSPFFFISFSTCFFYVCFGLPLPLLPLTSNFKAYTITFSSSFLKA